MFKHLLIPIDLSARNTRTLTIALELVVQSRARVTLFHVIHRVASVPLRELRGFYRHLRVKSEWKLAIAAAPFIRKGVRVHTRSPSGYRHSRSSSLPRTGTAWPYVSAPASLAARCAHAES
jgi:nucleotide-binding universal stress UspA family protein